MRYFCIMSGLRGCYMPDSVYSIAVKTRRELKDALAGEYHFQDHEGTAPARKREIASVAAALWRRSHEDRDSYLSNVIPTGPGYGIHINPISRAEYLEAQRNEEEF
jgi:hypothetical protein